ncbi:MAG: DEAD/DEAH box helicase, partial [Coraliomargarita sp.]
MHGPEDYEGKIIDTLYLSPIAYPTKPYHHLTKEDKLVRESRNDPVQDSRSSRQLLEDIYERFKKLKAEDLELYACAFHLAELPGMASVFEELYQSREFRPNPPIKPSQSRLLELFKASNEDRCCVESIEVIEGGNGPLVLAYIHAWLQSAAGSATIPYWVCRQISQIRPYLRKLRAEPCQSPDCKYCRTTHNPTNALKDFFGFPSFRPIPEVRGQPGNSLQEAIVSTAMRGESVLGILPTGGGKSLCFQTPALHRYRATGALSIVISPLQSLMRDQVENLKNRGGNHHTAALYGLLTPVERKYCLRDIRMGHVGLLYVSPEQ